ncbi:hypothetical protein FBALC1_16922 [Flavobacteriales bacterium ALC-1]|nr:hypothetical protein FBALC1_16922 [Flavobacteriales bacterium ALC-1]
MNFDDIKKQMDATHNNSDEIETTIKDAKQTLMPIHKVRKSMKYEIITQLFIIVVFFAFPYIVEIDAIPKGFYYILIFVTNLITLGYLLKMGWFLNKTSNITLQSKFAVLSFVHDLKLTLEVYKTAIIAGSLLLPLAIFALYQGLVVKDQAQFLKIISLETSITKLATYILVYLCTAVIIYFGTVLWANKLYGVHIKKLEGVIKDFD